MVAGWRRAWFDGDRVDLYRPGVRCHPRGGDWLASHLEARWPIADSPVSGVNQGGALRLHLERASGWAGSLGGAIADEAEPPFAVTRVVTFSAGVAWKGPRWGLRRDAEREERRDGWLRRALSLGTHLRC